MRRLLRLVLLLVATLAALLWPTPGGADAQVPQPAAVSAHNYDSHQFPEAVSDTAAERGPPAVYDLNHPFDDAGLQIVASDLRQLPGDEALYNSQYQWMCAEYLTRHPEQEYPGFWT